MDGRGLIGEFGCTKISWVYPPNSITLWPPPPSPPSPPCSLGRRDVFILFAFPFITNGSMKWLELLLRLCWQDKGLCICCIRFSLYLLCRRCLETSLSSPRLINPDAIWQLRAQRLWNVTRREHTETTRDQTVMKVVSIRTDEHQNNSCANKRLPVTYWRYFFWA